MSESEESIDVIEKRDREALAAINAVLSYLISDWITESCHAYTTMGCPSCQAILLRKQLDMLANAIVENLGDPLPPPPLTTEEAETK